jgi:UrcA family protein
MKTTSSTSLTASIAIVGALVAGFATGPAFAEDKSPFAFAFNFSPNELTNAPAAEKLLVRLEREVRSYCGTNRKMSLHEKGLVDQCVDTTLRESIAKFGSPMVAQAFQSRADG